MVWLAMISSGSSMLSQGDLTALVAFLQSLTEDYDDA